MDILSRNQKKLLAWLILLGHLAGQLALPFPAQADTLRPTIEQKTEAGLEQTLQAAGSEEVVFRSGDQLRVEAYQNVQKPAAETRSDRDWFLATANPHSDWKLELVYHPADISYCAFGHGIRWGFNYVHSPDNQRIVLGQDEMVSFSLMTEAGKDDLKKEYERKVKEANDRQPALVPALPLIHEQLNQLLSSPDLQSVEDQLRLKAISRIAQVEGYQRRVDVFDQKVIHEGRVIPIIPEDVDRYLGVLGELAATGQVQLEKSRIIQTELQRLRREIAVAVKQAQSGDPSGWDRMAARYSYLLENLSTFSIKIAALLRFVAIVQAHPAVQGKDPKDLKRWGSFGGGPWILLRAALRVRNPLQAAGIDVLGTEQHNFDFTTSMSAEGEKALALYAQVPPHQSYRVNIANTPIPLADGSLDVAEIGILGTLGEESNRQDIPKKIHLLLELNRVVDENGYLFIDVKNKPLPAAFRRALESYFGFKVLSDPVEHLGYDAAVRNQIAQGDPEKAEKLREHLRGGSLLVAVKVRAVDPKEVLKLKDKIAVLLRYDDSPEAQERSGYARTEASQPEEVDLSGLDYDQVQVATPNAPVVSGTPKGEILVKMPKLEEHLDQLERYRLLLPRRRVANRGMIQEEVQRLLIQWHNPDLATFDEADAVWLEQVYNEQIGGRLFDRDATYPVERVLEAFPNLKSQISELRRVKWDPLTENFHAAVENRTPLTLSQLEAHFTRIQEQLGMPLAQADWWYRRKYPPQAPYELIPATLYGHLLMVNAYAEMGEEKARVSKYLSRFQKVQARWLPLELSEIHADYLNAVERDAKWEAAQKTVRNRGQQPWSIRKTVEIVQERANAGLPIFTIDINKGEGAMVTAIHKRLSLGWGQILSIAFGLSPEALERYMKETYSEARRRGAAVRGQANWTLENLVKWVQDRRAQSPPLPVDQASAPGSARNAAYNFFPLKKWDAVLEAAGLTNEEITVGHKQAQQRRIDVTTRWSTENITKLILELFDADPSLESLMSSRLQQIKAKGAVNMVSRMKKRWNDVVLDVLNTERGLELEEGRRRLKLAQAKSRQKKASVETNGQIQIPTKDTEPSFAGLEELGNSKTIAVYVAVAEAAVLETGAVVLDAVELERAPELVTVIRQFRRFADRLVLLGESDTARELAAHLAAQGRIVQYVPERSPDAVTTALERIGGRGLGGVSFFGPEEAAGPVRVAAGALRLNFERPPVSIEMILRGFGVDPELAAELAAELDQTLGLAHEA